MTKLSSLSLPHTHSHTSTSTPTHTRTHSPVRPGLLKRGPCCGKDDEEDGRYRKEHGGEDGEMCVLACDEEEYDTPEDTRQQLHRQRQGKGGEGGGRGEEREMGEREIER